MRSWPPRTERPERILRESEKQSLGPRTITVSSGKGGVGKTSLSINLAICLAQMGNRVTLLDADLGMANVEVMLGLTPAYSLYDVLFRDKTMEVVAVKGPWGLNIISGGSGFLEMANLEQSRRRHLIRMLNCFSAQDDFVLIDTGAGISKNVLGFIAAAGEVVIVVTPEPTSLTDAYALIKVLANFKVHSEVYVVVNRAADKKEARKTLQRLQATADRFLKISIIGLGWLPEERLVSQAIKNQEPFFLASPNSQAARSVTSIAALLTNTAQPVQSERFWNKLMALFGRGV